MATTSFFFLFDVQGSNNNVSSLPNASGSDLPDSLLEFAGNIRNVENVITFTDVNTQYTLYSNISAAASSTGVGIFNYVTDNQLFRFRIERLLIAEVASDHYLYMYVRRIR